MSPPQANPQVLARLRASAPPPSRHFAWLQASTGRLSVFVPVLLGAGVVLSAAAWLVEWAGRLTARPTLESRLARRLEVLALPPGGLLGDGRADPFAPRSGARQL